MKVDRKTSTVEISGRRFPAAAVICPPDPEPNDGRSEYDRSLWATGTEFCIPAENGVLFLVSQLDSGLLELCMHCRVCELDNSWPHEDVMYLPIGVGLRDGDLVAPFDACRDLWDWRLAEPGWVIETIDRLSRKPFTQPPGEEVRLVPLDYFGEQA